MKQIAGGRKFDCIHNVERIGNTGKKISGSGGKYDCAHIVERIGDTGKKISGIGNEDKTGKFEVEKVVSRKINDGEVRKKIAKFLLHNQNTVEGDDVKEFEGRSLLSNITRKETAVTPNQQKEVAEFFEIFYSFCDHSNPSYKDLLNFCSKILSGGLQFFDKKTAFISKQQKGQAKFFKGFFLFLLRVVTLVMEIC